MKKLKRWFGEETDESESETESDSDLSDPSQWKQIERTKRNKMKMKN